ncbi:MAG TPA: ABC transporter permease [Pseudonocardiaceae bacterium]
MRSVTRSLLGLAGFLLFWEVVGRSGLAEQDYLPPTSVILVELVDLLTQQKFLLDLIATVLAWLIALGIATVVAVPLGLLLGSVPILRTGTRAVIEFLRPIPSVALIPLVIVAFGGGPDAKIALAVYAGVWPILLNAVYALDEVDPLLIQTARSFGLGRLAVLLRVSLPSAAPFVLTGIRVSAAISLVVVITTEMTAGGSVGLGRFILEISTNSAVMAPVLAATVIAGLCGWLANSSLEWAQRRWLPWSTTTTREAE